MSAILQLTQEAILLEGGRIARRGPTGEVVDEYLSSDFSKSGERIWAPGEVPAESEPFRPQALRIRNPAGTVVDTVRSTEPIMIEMAYTLSRPITGLRIGIYLQSMRGELVFTSFDTDQPEQYEQFSQRGPGGYLSRCAIPADLLNEGRYLLGVNASSFRVKRYFQDERALAFNVDPTGAPGMQWPEPRRGMLRPRLDWEIVRIPEFVNGDRGSGQRK
jgi:lipopolysaccharide transport system ATP-binding protein